MVSKESIKKNKEIVKKYQGKYYLGYEVNGTKTYLFIKKICVREHLREDSFITYSDIIFSFDNWVNFEQNRDWYFGTNFIESYGYEEIPKSLFMSVVRKYGFKKLRKNDMKYHSDSVKADYK